MNSSGRNNRSSNRSKLSNLKKSWSFCLFGKKQSRCEPSSTFYYDKFNELTDITSNFDSAAECQEKGNKSRFQKLPKNARPSPSISDIDICSQDGDEDLLLPFCCGLSKPQRSTSFDSKANCDSMFTKTSTNIDKIVEVDENSKGEPIGKDNDSYCNQTVLVPIRNKKCTNVNGDIRITLCKRGSLYPQDVTVDLMNNHIISHEHGELYIMPPPSPPPKTFTALSVQQRKKLFERLTPQNHSNTPPDTSTEDSTSKNSSEGQDERSKLESFQKKQFHSPQSFRKSFTTEDCDIFTKTYNYSATHKHMPKPSVPPKSRHLMEVCKSSEEKDSSSSTSKEDLQFSLALQLNSHSMKDLSSTKDQLTSTTEASDANKPKVITKPKTPAPLAPLSKNFVLFGKPSNHNDATLPSKPQVPPRRSKLLFQLGKHPPEEDSSSDGIPKQLRAFELPGSESQSRPEEVRVSPVNERPYSCSDSDSFEDSDNDDSTCYPENVDQTFEANDSNACPMSKVQKVANELLETEKVYVNKLYLIDQIFHLEIIRRNRVERFLPDDVIPQIFSNIKCIYQFHNDYLLPELTSCMAKWDDGPAVGSVMKKAAPFFKLYTEYVTNFSNANGLIAAWIIKSEKFALLLEELQQCPECGNLTLQHHLLEPIQRVPRYQLLLGDYLKHMPEDSSDRESVEVALKLVTEAAQHTNDEMKKMDKFKKLLDTCAMLVHSKEENLISINRELVKEGRITKVSARDGAHLERYLFLFNDGLLVCMSLPLKIGFGQQYLVKNKLDICGMKVYDGNSEDNANTFVVMSKQKSIEFATSTTEEKINWMKEIWAIIAQYIKIEKTKDKEFLLKTYHQNEELGKRAPTWVKDQDTSMCMLCSVTFSTFRRRHHCRACGKVVCNECSTHKLKMDFDKKLNRVCEVCYGVLESTSLSTPKINQRHKGPSVLGIKATNEEAVLFGYLNVSFDQKTWNRRWLVLHSNCALYIFKAKRDNAASDSLPLPGYRVEACNKEDDQKLNLFKVFHDKLPKVYFFSTEDKTLFTKWMESLKLAVLAELPLPSSPRLQPSLNLSVAPTDDLCPIEEITDNDVFMSDIC